MNNPEQDSQNLPIQVLIVEDDVRIAEINRRFVEKVNGYEVIGIATDGTQAKEQVEIFLPQLVLLDVYFPDMNGFDLLRHINQHYSETDVIMITAAKEVNAIKNAIRNGVFDFILKPVVFDRFQDTLIRYKEFHNKLNILSHHETVYQEDIDALLKQADNRKIEIKSGYYYPKGIDKLTLDKVTLTLSHEKEGLTTEEVGKRIGCSRTTARRYLEYLVSANQVTAELSYGIVGRPERIYRPT